MHATFRLGPINIPEIFNVDFIFTVAHQKDIEKFAMLEDKYF